MGAQNKKNQLRKQLIFNILRMIMITLRGYGMGIA
jgi:hypothetical protein